MNTFNIALIGKSGVGKSTYLRRLIVGDYKPPNESTIGCPTHQVTFDTTKRQYRFNVTEINETIKNPSFGKYDGCIAMYDLEQLTTIAYVEKMTKEMKCPIVYCANKDDTIKAKENARYKFVLPCVFNTSAKHNLNMKEPFLKVIHLLTNDESIEFPSLTKCGDYKHYDDEDEDDDDEESSLTFADELRELVFKNWIQKWKTQHLPKLYEQCKQVASQGYSTYIFEFYCELPSGVTKHQFCETINAQLQKECGFKLVKCSCSEYYPLNEILFGITLEW